MMLKGSSLKVRKRTRGFTLIELLIYIALVSLFLTAATASLLDVILGNTKSSVQQEVQENLRYVSYRILFEIRNADSVNVGSSFGVNFADSSAYELSLAAPSPNNPVKFRVNSGVLQVKRGAQDWGNFTSSAVQVANLTFSDVSDAESESVGFTITIRYLNPSGRSQWEKEETFKGAATLR